MTQTMEWNLASLYQGLDDPKIDSDLAQLHADAAQFIEKFRPQIEQLPKNQNLIAEALAAYCAMTGLAHNLNLYATLSWHVAMQNAQTAQLKEKVAHQITEIQNSLQFFLQRLAHLTPEERQFLLADPKIQNFKTYLESLSLFQPYLLSEAEERLLTTQQQFSRRRWQDFYQRLTGNWSFQVQLDNQALELSEDQAMDLTRTEDPDKRKAGYLSVYSQYGKHQDQIAYIYNSLIQEYAAEAKLRGFHSTLAQQAFEQYLTEEQVLLLLAKVKEQTPLFQRYYAFVKDYLKLDTLFSWDKTIPLGVSKTITYAQAQEIIRGAMQRLDPELAENTQAFFENHWIHAKIQPGKASGAFCAPAAQSHPFVLVNWNDNMYSLTALAHELGHGLHFYETSKHQHILDLMPSLYLAETASTLNEYLLADHLMEAESRSDFKLQFLSDLLQRFLNGLYRQSLISDFEVVAHQRGQNQSLTPQALGEIWYELATQQAGEAITVVDEEYFGWSRIPHIFMHPFYCFNYTLSSLVVLELIYQYQHQREAFIPRYRQFLRAGGSRSPQELLALLEINIESESFYQQAFSTLEDLINQLQKLQST